ncbi:uncharacterized protein LOC144102621 [Amblyomma americanum]
MNRYQIVQLTALLTLWFLSCNCQVDFSQREEGDKEKEENMRNLLNGTEQLVLLFAKNGPQSLHKTSCWTSKKIPYSGLGFRYTLSHQNRINLFGAVQGYVNNAGGIPKE